MATLTDIALDVQDSLHTIITNTANTESAVLQVKGDTGALILRTNAHIAVSQTGFANLSQGLAQILLQQFATNQQLKYQIAQNDAIICWLRIIANLLCDIKRQLEASHEVYLKIEKALDLLEEIMELVHGSEAIQVHNNKELESRMDKCCPPPRPDPKPCFEGCPAPTKPPEIPNPDFKPLPRPDQPGTTTGTTPATGQQPG